MRNIMDQLISAAIRRLRPDVVSFGVKPDGTIIQWDGPTPPPSHSEIVSEAQKIADEEADPVPQSITMRQLLIGLMGAEWITPTQADAWSADGTLPATITAVIDALPTEAERVAARITARKMSNAYRNDPLLISAAQAAMPDATEEEINEALDQSFRDWSKL